MRRFVLFRHTDVSEISGEGVVVWGLVFPDGRVAYRWNTATATTSVADSIDDVLEIHGHGGATELLWVDGAADADAWKTLTLGAV